MPTTDLLKALLDCPHLPDGWYDFYGVSESRSDALTAPAASPDSFVNPNSETALTLFLLGKVDGWKQLGHPGETPRFAGGRWNPKFFQRLTAQTPVEPFGGGQGWLDPDLRRDLFATDEWEDGDARGLILLFEVEAGGQALRQVAGADRSGIKLSFLNLDGLTRWARFDAVIINPARRLFYFVEAKLGSDLSPDTEKYTLVNQAVRSLEAGYWLTRDPASKYATDPKGPWDFRLVLLCPRPLWAYRLRLYTHLLWSADAVAEMLGHYRRLVEDKYKDSLRPLANFRLEFEQFVGVASRAVRIVHWDTLAAAVAPAASFWSGYFGRVKAAYEQVRPKEEADSAVDAIRTRLRIAGVDVGDPTNAADLTPCG